RRRGANAEEDEIAEGSKGVVRVRAKLVLRPGEVGRIGLSVWAALLARKKYLSELEPEDTVQDLNMFEVERLLDRKRRPVGGVVELQSIYRFIQLVPAFGKKIDHSLRAENSISRCKRFYINSFADKEIYQAVCSLLCTILNLCLHFNPSIAAIPFLDVCALPTMSTIGPLSPNAFEALFEGNIPEEDLAGERVACNSTLKATMQASSTRSIKSSATRLEPRQAREIQEPGGNRECEMPLLKTLPAIVFLMDEIGKIEPFKYMDSRLESKVLSAEVKKNFDEDCLVYAPQDGFWVLPVRIEDETLWSRSDLPDPLLEAWGPRFFAFRTPILLSGKVLRRLTELVTKVLEGDGVSHDGTKAWMINDESRSLYAAHHVGVVSHYGTDDTGPKGLRLSKDTLRQKPLAQNAIHRLFHAIQEDIVPTVTRLLRQIDPQRVLAYLGDELADNVADFGGAFFCMALSKGHSDNIHLDGTDHTKSYAFIIPLGEFTGGDLVLPTLHLSIPVRPGQILAVTASFLPHYISTVSGTRYAATLFTDKFLASRMRDVLLKMGISRLLLVAKENYLLICLQTPLSAWHGWLKRPREFKLQASDLQAFHLPPVRSFLSPHPLDNRVRKTTSKSSAFPSSLMPSQAPGRTRSATLQQPILDSSQPNPRGKKLGKSIPGSLNPSSKSKDPSKAPELAPHMSNSSTTFTKGSKKPKGKGPTILANSASPLPPPKKGKGKAKPCSPPPDSVPFLQQNGMDSPLRSLRPSKEEAAAPSYTPILGDYPSEPIHGHCPSDQWDETTELLAPPFSESEPEEASVLDKGKKRAHSPEPMTQRKRATTNILATALTTTAATITNTTANAEAVPANTPAAVVSFAAVPSAAVPSAAAPSGAVPPATVPSVASSATGPATTSTVTVATTSG
ncbi:9120_t:CDS:10, partial [Acaulospora colombiana]